MQTMTGTASLAANTTSLNLLAGLLGEFATSPSIVRFYLTSSATGMNATAQVGDKVILQDMLISLANRFPIRPDDLAVEGGALKGDRLSLRFRNTTAGALTYWFVVDVIPVG